jgi:4-hydroxybenzoate polyprenyltransferase
VKVPPIIQCIFFGHYFYGICAVLLSIENCCLLQIDCPSVLYCLTIFFSTAVYYTHAYRFSSTENSLQANDRTQWYQQHKKNIQYTQIIYTILILVFIILFLQKQLYNKTTLPSVQQICLWAIFPIMASCYYGVYTSSTSPYSLRRIGWLKPFIIGGTWAGVTSVYPLLVYLLNHASNHLLVMKAGLLFGINFVFISMLSILFDVKDHVADRHQNIHTFLVRRGLRKTIFSILFPLAVIGIGLCGLYANKAQWSILQLIIYVIPFIFLRMCIKPLLRNRQSTWFYLLIIDGLIALKAAGGILAACYWQAIL